ncbi:MAG TPA: hypothetical protein VFX76_00255, partial [Roseiflexaceae bacterium]|nr:hypothetical protein [Roseiflexaceae bacterium]
CRRAVKPSDGVCRNRGFIPEALAGHAKVLGSNSGQYFELKVDYRIQHAASMTTTNLFSNDGNLSLFVAPGSLPLAMVDFLIATPWGLPGEAPPDRKLIGEAYEISASNNVTSLQQPATLRLRYDSLQPAASGQPTIYHWDLTSESWQPLKSSVDAGHHEVIATITELGVYALMDSPAKVYLPIVC